MSKLLNDLNWVFSMSDMRGERLQVMLSPEELTAIDDFRFKHRMPTRAAAVRELFKLGLTVVAADGGGLKSSNYGVFSRGPDGHTHGHDGHPAFWASYVRQYREAAVKVSPGRQPIASTSPLVFPCYPAARYRLRPGQGVGRLDLCRHAVIARSATAPAH